MLQVSAASNLWLVLSLQQPVWYFKDMRQVGAGVIATVEDQADW